MSKEFEMLSYPCACALILIFLTTLDRDETAVGGALKPYATHKLYNKDGD